MQLSEFNKQNLRNLLFEMAIYTQTFCHREIIYALNVDYLTYYSYQLLLPKLGYVNLYHPSTPSVYQPYDRITNT